MHSASSIYGEIFLRLIFLKSAFGRFCRFCRRGPACIGTLHVARAKNAMPSVHPLTGTELRSLRRLQREQEPGRYVFMSERGAPMTAVAFRRMLTRLGQTARMPFGIHPHMLRHSTGFKLANQGVDTRSLQ